MSEIYDNLMVAFAGESQANRKYLAYAKKGEEEGHTQVARLFRAVARRNDPCAQPFPLRRRGEINCRESECGRGW